MNTKQVIIWDWDNTLVNSRPIVEEALNDLSEHYKLGGISAADISSVMGTHRGLFWTSHFKDLPTAIGYYQACYLRRLENLTPDLLPGAKKMLDFFKENEIPQLVLSNKRQDILNKECDLTGLRSYFTTVQGTDLTQDPPGKPQLSFALKALKNMAKRRILLIGDGLSDMKMAEVLKATGFYVRAAGPEEGVPYRYYFNNLNDVFSFLNTEEGKKQLDS